MKRCYFCKKRVWPWQKSGPTLPVIRINAWWVRGGESLYLEHTRIGRAVLAVVIYRGRDNVNDPQNTHSFSASIDLPGTPEIFGESELDIRQKVIETVRAWFAKILDVGIERVEIVEEEE